ncbi:hypothetical protein LCGC14_0333780 [marine sediment metagenome]|uniref:Dimethylargininase n=1 Tax=marine sediment metagenome TaxID=412755 RepID=A0A0F9TLE4_9ZZZZ|nr:hypothetical protein [Phycisphaerae bacterium]HDZ44078.1 hypothetical protein [Phycisphaerae bacterium]
MIPTVTHALVRRPGENFCDGVTTADLGRPDYAAVLAQHAAYCDALQQAGVAVTVLDADERFPDGVFIEDAAVVVEACAVIARPGAPSRAGEQHAVEEVLAAAKPIRRIEAPGTLDGGDVLRVGERFFIGLSKRTNEPGAQQLADILTEQGYSIQTATVGGALHLKTAVVAVNERTLLAADETADAAAFGGFDIIRVAPDESYAANCLPVNGMLLVPEGFPKTAERLRSIGCDVREIDMSEFRKMDGGLTCLSLLW